MNEVENKESMFSKIFIAVAAILIANFFLNLDSINGNKNRTENIRKDETIENPAISTSKNSIPSNTEINQSDRQNSSVSTKPNKLSSNESKPKETEEEDFRSYINPSITNTSDKTNIAVTVVDEKGNISFSISSSIANIYNQTESQGSSGLIRSNFVHKSGFQELFEGNSEIIEKLKLSSHADYVAIGKISYPIIKGTLEGGTFVCKASVTMNIISTSQKSLVKSFTCPAIGNGVTEDQAKEYAINKLLRKYTSDYSSI